MVIISPKLTLSFVKSIALILGTKTSVDILFSLILPLTSFTCVSIVSFFSLNVRPYSTYAVTLTTCTSLAIMQESGSDELSLFNPKGIYPFLFGD
jgi:hypothetical protein